MSASDFAKADRDSVSSCQSLDRLLDDRQSLGSPKISRYPCCYFALLAFVHNARGIIEGNQMVKRGVTYIYSCLKFLPVRAELLLRERLEKMLLLVGFLSAFQVSTTTMICQILRDP